MAFLPGTADDRRDALVLLAILFLGALLRLPGIDARGTWEDDQGQQVLAVQQWLATGSPPLLGPPSSIGDVHHGVATYWLFLPAAALSGSDPVAVTVLLALLGLVGVAATWGLARTIGGVAAGHVAGVLAALSPTWIETSTFIWNANIVGPAAAVALLGAWRAWETGRVRWWLLAGGAAIVLAHAHLLGTVLLPPLIGLAIADWRRRAGAGRRRLGGALGAVLVAFALTLVPLAIHEATTDFGEARALLDYAESRLAGTAPEVFDADPLPARLGIVAWRVASWPVTGLIVDAPVASALVTVVLAVLLGWRAAVSPGVERTFVRWSIAAFGFAIVALATLAPSLSRVVRGLPNDHYHAFVDPLVLTVIALAAAAWWRSGSDVPVSADPVPGDALPGGALPGTLPSTLRTPTLPAGLTPGRVAAVAAVVVTVAVGLGAVPRAVAPDGGWPLARDAGARIVAATGGREIVVVPVASFKTGHAVTLPLVLAGADVSAWSLGEGLDDEGLRSSVTEATIRGGALVLVCDPLFEDVLGAVCGGPAEEARLAEVTGGGAGGAGGAGGGAGSGDGAGGGAGGPGAWRLADRFEAGSRRTLSVYVPAGG